MKSSFNSLADALRCLYHKIVPSAFTILGITVLSTSIYAQKLPNKQDASLHAPGNVKIDGKIAEWGNGLKAYNRATNLFYTIANDDDNLYLIIKATDKLTVRKIIAGSITFGINAISKKNGDESMAITYPLQDTKNRLNINIRNIPAPTADASDNTKAISDFKDVINTEFTSKAKYIGIRGVKASKDTAIAIYNEENIKAAALFDDDIAYNYELCIPLKYILSTLNNARNFEYNIRLNGSSDAEGTHFEMVTGGMLVTSKSIAMASTADMLLISSPTDFSAEYTLSK